MPRRPASLAHLDRLGPWLDRLLVQCREPSPTLEPAADWLLDNEYRIRRAVRQVDKDLPEDRYAGLPALDGLSGCARALESARCALLACELQPTAERLVPWLDRHQRLEPLFETELWALPALLRLSCLEWLVAGVAQLTDTPEAPFAVADIVAADTDAVTEVAQGSISDVIGALVMLNEADWPNIVERVSRLHAVLLREECGIYAALSPETRIDYRRAVERLARLAGMPEPIVGEAVVRRAGLHLPDARSGHVGYWLTGDGLAEFETSLGARPSRRERWQRWAYQHAGALFAIGLTLAMVLALTIPLGYLLRIQDGVLPVLGTGLFFLVPASVLAVGFVHWLILSLVPPARLPSLDWRAGIPAGTDTLVAMPVIVHDVAEIAGLMQRLEMHHLANPDPRLSFVLLSDPADADTERQVQDATLEHTLIDGIQRLNRCYPVAVGSRFVLLHRHRVYNSSEQCWMGRERKRGKLEDLNALIVQGGSRAFAVIEGQLEGVRRACFVITLDADTTLPPDSAVRLVCQLAHPLNRAHFDAGTGRICAGYTLLQPRVETLAEAGSSTWFAHLYAGDGTIDIYSHAVSDVYQDLFGSGNYVGKGIYDVHAFHRSLAGRLPPNRILSHDLLEGLHGRVGLASEIVLYEGFPSRWFEHALRQHRWIRGDWQLLPWLGRRVPMANGARVRNRLSGLDRWKLCDNLRRSLVAPGLLGSFLAGWFLLPGSALVWTLLGIGAFMPYLLDETVAGLARVSRRRSSRGAGHRLVSQLMRSGLAVVFLVGDTRIALDAIVRAVWRSSISARHCLEWTTAERSHFVHDAADVRQATWRVLWPSPVLAVGAGTSLLRNDPATFMIALPILLGWLLAPWVALWLGRPRVARREVLRAVDRDFLREVARRTWHYFERFVGPDDHWLPPDNFQRQPVRRLARRTSPTNIGLYLASSVVAVDLGFIGTRELAARAGSSLHSLQLLERHRGHLLNWYNTATLAPLEPRYVSTVDSGNLAICLLALIEGCRDGRQAPIVTQRVFQGLQDTLHLLIDTLPVDKPGLVAAGERVQQAAGMVHKVLLELIGCDDFDVGAYGRLVLLQRHHWPIFEQAIAGYRDTEELDALIVARHTWLERFDHQLQTVMRDVDNLCPWLRVLREAPAGCASPASQIQTHWPVGSALSQAQARCQAALELTSWSSAAPEHAVHRWQQRLMAALHRGRRNQQALDQALAAVMSEAGTLYGSMDFGWLYDAGRRLLRIGHDISAGRMDPNHYDLLASEARIASFVAIARREVPLEHWYALGRPVVRTQGRPTVRSWNGSMFEYLMPPLFLPARRDTLLGDSESCAVLAQQSAARVGSIPWGVSESAFAATDAEGNYQYRAFGTSSLGLRRGLELDQVVAPYASALALGVWPVAAVRNLHHLETLGSLQCYGFVDALDFTASRQPTNARFTLVETWMAHHQGMSMLAIANALFDDLIPRRVLRTPALHAVELLLQERVPWEVEAETVRTVSALEPPEDSIAGERFDAINAWLPAAHLPVPHLHCLGNGRLSARIRRDGGSTLFYEGVALTRWSNDTALEHRGGYRLHQRVVEPDAGPGGWLGQSPPGGPEPDVVFSAHEVDVVQHEQGLATRVESVIAPHDDIDIRRITLTNERDTPCTLVITSHAEIALARPEDDERHPAFSRLFVASHAELEHDGLFFERRARDVQRRVPCLLHRVLGDEHAVLQGFETDRRRWLGRHGDPQRPAGLVQGLSGTTGYTLDPVMVLQVHITLPAGAVAQVAFLTLAGESREVLLERSARLSLTRIDRLLQDAAQAARRELHRRRLSPSLLPVLQYLASVVLHPHPNLRRVSESVDEPGCQQSELWVHGLSGDLPIVLLHMDEKAPLGTLEALLKAQALWRHRGLKVDLVVLRTGPAGYDEPLRARVMDRLREAGMIGQLGQDGGVHVVSVPERGTRSRVALEDAASVVLDGSLTVEQGLEALLQRPPPVAPLICIETPAAPELAPIEPLPERILDNGYGGFTSAGDAYVLNLPPGLATPSPWCNILANERFGCIVSEAGLGFCWADNSGERRLSRWSGDPVLDTPGELLWVRDESSGDYWGVPPGAPFHDTAVEVTHGLGFSQWRRHDHGLEQSLLCLVPTDAPVRLVRLQLVNRADHARSLSVTYFVDWVLGAMPGRVSRHSRSGYDLRCEAILACNDWNSDFAGRMAFLAASLPAHSVSGDRAGFIGEAGDLRRPAAMSQRNLGGRFTPGAAPCGAWQVYLELAPGEHREVLFVVGEGTDRGEAETLLQHWRDPARVPPALEQLAARWQHLSGALQVSSPDPGFDVLVNHWLLYQSLSSRLYARAGFYQANGAWGFRDQLQDVLAVLHVEPALARKQILRAAACQFEAGDVLHWWHPPLGRGVRTRFSDDRLWLPFVTAHYVQVTGELELLDHELPWLAADPLRPDEDDRYNLFEPVGRDSLFEHCARALECGMAIGAHGLPLMGSGDWNDGMDRIGREGRGESLWLAWFRMAVVALMAPLAEARGAHQRAALWRAHADGLARAIETHGWDGQWYVRAFDDDGLPWGSASCEECRIDAIAQAWGALAGRADSPRVHTALSSAESHLIDRRHGLARLLTPPFDRTPRDPGYIKAYPPGIRENGGQYTHAAAWLGLANVQVGRAEQAWELFNMISPIRHSLTAESARHYRTEPYVLAADIGGVEPHLGVGGWSWYTGAAGWTWQLAVRGILGIEHIPGGVRIKPCLPLQWPSVDIELRSPQGRIVLHIEQTDFDTDTDTDTFLVDGKPAPGPEVRFPIDGTIRRVLVRTRFRCTDLVTSDRSSDKDDETFGP